MSQLAEPTIEDLYREPGKAELIDGRLVRYKPVGHRPNVVAGRIFRKLAEYVDESGRGVAYTDSMGFAVPRLRSRRQSFSPDAAYYDGELPRNPMRFVEGPPTLAVEVSSEGDYDERAEVSIAAKRADYFEAGTLVVWDVDPVEETVSVFRRSDPEHQVVYRRGQEAEAEPAVPGWKLDLAWCFR